MYMKFYFLNLFIKNSLLKVFKTVFLTDISDIIQSFLNFDTEIKSKYFCLNYSYAKYTLITKIFL